MSFAKAATTVPRPLVSELLQKAEKYADAEGFDHAATFYRAAVVLDRTVHSRVSYAMFLADHARTEGAERELLQAWELARRTQDHAGCALVCHNLAVLNIERGRVLEASQYQQWALNAWYRRTNGIHSVLPAWLRRLTATCWMGTDEEADGWRLAFESSARPDDLESNLDAAVRAEEAGDGERAVQILVSLLTATGLGEMSIDRAEVLERLGNLQRRRGGWREAARCQAAAATIYGKRQQFVRRSRCFRQLAEIEHVTAVLDSNPEWN